MLSTTRLSLRRPTPSDLDAVWAITGDPVACAHNPADLVYSRSQAAELLEAWIDHWEVFRYGYWVVRERDETTVLGFCGVKFLRLGEVPVLNLFYRFAPPNWGAGLATEAATAAVRWARTHWPWYPVVARVRPDNTASQRVAVKAGLVRTPSLDRYGQDGLDWIYELAVAPTGALSPSTTSASSRNPPD